MLLRLDCLEPDIFFQRALAWLTYLFNDVRMHFARRGIVEFTWLIVLRALRAELGLIRELETLGLVSHRLVTQVFIL